MPKRRSDDIDKVPVEPDPRPAKATKRAPPEPMPIPHFNPLKISHPRQAGEPRIPPGTDPQSPIQIFQLFWTEELWKIFAEHTNRYAELHPAPPLPGARPWFDTTAAELKAYIAVYICTSIHPVKSIEELWNRSDRSPIHLIVTSAIGVKLW